jgi:hypothetical protein
MPTAAELLLANSPPNIPKNALKRAEIAVNLALIRGRLNTLQKRLRVMTVKTPPTRANVLLVKTPSPSTLSKAKNVLGSAEYKRLMNQARMSPPTRSNVLLVRTPSPGTLSKAKKILGSAEYSRLLKQAKKVSPPKPRTNYASMSVKNLQKIARDKGYKGFSKYARPGLIKFLQNKNGV